MPIYEYRRPNGETVEVFMTLPELPKRQKTDGTIEINGEICKRTFRNAHVIAPPGNWPLRSKAMGVGVDEIAAAKADDRRHGLKHDYDPETGDALFSGVGQKRQALKKHGWRDNDAYV